MSDQSIPTVEYRPVAGCSAYRVGGDGSVWSRWRKGPGATATREQWRRMRTRPDREGYHRVTLIDDDGNKRSVKVCVLVLTAFAGPRPPGQECRHVHGLAAGDGIGNLAWGTSLENHADKQRHGTTARGDRHGKTKLSEDQIAAVLALKGQATQQVVADRYGVSRGYVGQLWSGARARVPG